MSALPRTPGQLPAALERRLSMQLTVLGWLTLIVVSGLLGIIAAPILDRILLTAFVLGLVCLAIASAVEFFRGD